MKPSAVLMALLLAVVGAGASLAQTPRPASAGPSLGDMARQLKEQRAKALVKPQTVFTNDNLPKRPPGEGPTAATGISTTAATTESTPAATGTLKTETKTQAAASSSGNDEIRNEKYYRRKMKDLQARLSIHQRELSVLEQKLSQNQMQYYSDPQKTLTQESTPAFYSDVNKRRSDVENKKQQIADDQKAVDDLQDQLRRDGGDPGWLRQSPSAPPPAETQPPAAESKPPEAPSKPEKSPAKAEDKIKTREYWQAKFKAVREQLARAQEAQQLVEDEVQLLEIQQAREITPEVQTEVAQKIAAKKQELETHQAATAKAQEALDEVEKDFKDSGAPEEWAKSK